MLEEWPLLAAEHADPDISALGWAYGRLPPNGRSPVDKGAVETWQVKVGRGRLPTAAAFSPVYSVWCRPRDARFCLVQKA